MLDLTRSIAGPWTTRMLADAGAEVIKAEPLLGDFVRHLPASTGEFASGYFHQANAGKLSISIDLHTAAGLDLLMRFVPHVDVVMHNMRPNAARRLNITAENIHAVNKRAIFCQVSGYGADSVFVEKPGQDMAIQCMTGISELTGAAGGEPAVPLWSLADTLTSAYAYSGICSALHARETRGLERISIELTMAECAALLHDVGPYLVAQDEETRIERSGQFHPFLVLRGVVTVQGGFVAISAFRNRHWANLAPMLGLAGQLMSFEERRARKDEIEERVSARFAPKTVAQALAELDSAGVPAEEVLQSLESVAETGLFQARGMLVQTSGPQLVSGMIHRENCAAAMVSGPPILGADNFYAFHELLGIEKAEILELLSDGVIGCAPEVLADFVSQCSEAVV